ncbi:hypothetical protein ACTA71_004165 [Dictyostelium dimigraforme]
MLFRDFVFIFLINFGGIIELNLFKGDTEDNNNNNNEGKLDLIWLWIKLILIKQFSDVAVTEDDRKLFEELLMLEQGVIGEPRTANSGWYGTHISMRNVEAKVEDGRIVSGLNTQLNIIKRIGDNEYLKIIRNLTTSAIIK